MTFAWKWSYQNQVGYRFYGVPGIGNGEIEAYRELGLIADYMRKTFNGGPESFKLNVEDAIGGARVNHGGKAWNRWTPELYAGFVEFLTEAHARDLESSKRFRAQYPDVDFGPMPKLVLPRPIYWDDGAGHWANEPWYTPAEVAA